MRAFSATWKTALALIAAAGLAGCSTLLGDFTVGTPGSDDASEGSDASTGGDAGDGSADVDADARGADAAAVLDALAVVDATRSDADATGGNAPADASAEAAAQEDATVEGADAGDAAEPDAPVPDGGGEGGCAGGTICDAGCTQLADDPRNCGACDHDCTQLSNVATAGLACIAGRCAYECAPGYADCADSGVGCATSLRSTSSCGACGATCTSSAPACASKTGGGFACAPVCPSGTMQCGDTCADLMSDSKNCGGCSLACASGMNCASSGCVCSTGTNCSGTCVDTTSDSKNCGACGTSCPAGTRCSGSACVCDSTSGCNGCCSSTTTCETYASQSSASCGPGGGACAACGGGQTCDTTGGKCVCPSGQASCGGRCVDEQTDPANCGACGTVCPISCNSGTCLKAVSLATGGVNSTMCAVLSDGTVRCWGSNYFGEIGNGVATQGTANADQGVSKPTPVLNLTNATAASVGYGQSCAITSAGGAACWGANSNGELGDGNTCTPSCPASVDLMAGPVIDLANVLAISASGSPAYGDFTCALVPGGLVYCWGAGGDGQLGNGSMGNVTQLTPAVVSISRATAIATYALGGCALVSGGTVSCWGSATAGQVGPGAQQLTPAQVPGLAGVTAISAGDFSACALLTAGTVDCWGYDYDGEVGNGQSGLVNVSPTPVVGLAGLKVTAVSVGQEHACALISDGTVRCWGDNGAGELGNGTVSVVPNQDILSPVKVVGLNDAIQISAGDDFTCALESNGAVVCWGDNSIAELGNGTMSVNPQPMPGLVQW